MSRLAIAMSQTLGSNQRDRFFETALELRCIRQECRVIREELRAHLATHR
jgi:hypothetical protein